MELVEQLRHQQTKINANSVDAQHSSPPMKNFSFCTYFTKMIPEMANTSSSTFLPVTMSHLFTHNGAMSTQHKIALCVILVPCFVLQQLDWDVHISILTQEVEPCEQAKVVVNADKKRDNVAINSSDFHLDS